MKCKNCTLDRSLIYNWKRIYSPVHSLAFMCDPHFFEMRKHCDQKHGSEFTGMGTDVFHASHDALKILSDDAMHEQLLMGEFMDFSVQPNRLLLLLKEWQPRLIWGQLQSVYPSLSKVLFHVYRSPASTAGVERNHKMNKRVHSKIRCRIAETKVEKQVSVAHNSSQFLRNLQNKRTSRFERHIARHFEETESTAPVGEENPTDSVDIESTPNENNEEFDFDVPLSIEESELEQKVWQIDHPPAIMDSFLFDADIGHSE